LLKKRVYLFLYNLMKIIVKGFDPNKIKKFLDNVLVPFIRTLQSNDVMVSKVYLKKKMYKYIVNKSPHIFNKSKEHFALIYVTQIIKLSKNNYTKTEFCFIKKYLTKQNVNGISLCVYVNG